MPWQDELNRLKASIERSYTVRMRQAVERRSLLEKFAVDLEVETYLAQMSDTLLNGHGRIITKRSWEYDFDDDLDDDEEELSDEIVYTLYWHDGSPVEVEIRVGIDEDDAGYVVVEDEEIDDNPADIQEALLQAFRDIADIDD
jgi:hypothetical protein